jgi:hypothetical protein
LDAGPLRRWRRGAGAGVRKPPKEETAGRKGSGGRDLWGFAGRGWSAGVGPEAVGRRLRRSEGRWRACSIVPMRGLSASRGAKRLWRGLGGHCHPGPARGWKGKRSTLQGEMRGAGHEVSILIRLGDGDRAGRGPSNVSTMIIRPPQHGQRRAGATSSASRPASARERWGAPSDAASAWRTRSMLRARHVPANRP